MWGNTVPPRPRYLSRKSRINKLMLRLPRGFEEMVIINTVCLTGRISIDPSQAMKYTPAGDCVLTFILAVERDNAKPDDKQKADFITCVAWKKTAEFIGQYLDKGARVEVVGCIRVRQYEHDGQPRTNFEIVANSVQALESKEAAELRRAKAGQPKTQA